MADLVSHCALGELPYKPMLRAASNPEQVQLGVDTAMDGAAFEDPRTAELAAEALRTVPTEVLVSHRSRVLELLDVWKRRGSWCYGCERVVLGSFCENCRVVPPQPREHLVYLGFMAGALNFQDLLKLANEARIQVGRRSDEKPFTMGFQRSKDHAGGDRTNRHWVSSK